MTELRLSGEYSYEERSYPMGNTLEYHGPGGALAQYAEAVIDGIPCRRAQFARGFGDPPTVEVSATPLAKAEPPKLDVQVNVQNADL